ncbi:Hypothetical protein PBC10988_7470 [Planctomycetales bacterium 10988]|nr:Hypothetical protein PBC10988_7470 [Planctomycetales bacterium 10988]
MILSHATRTRILFAALGLSSMIGIGTVWAQQIEAESKSKEVASRKVEEKRTKSPSPFRQVAHPHPSRVGRSIADGAQIPRMADSRSRNFPTRSTNPFEMPELQAPISAGDPWQKSAADLFGPKLKKAGEPSSRESEIVEKDERSEGPQSEPKTPEMLTEPEEEKPIETETPQPLAEKTETASPESKEQEKGPEADDAQPLVEMKPEGKTPSESEEPSILEPDENEEMVVQDEPIPAIDPSQMPNSSRRAGPRGSMVDAQPGEETLPELLIPEENLIVTPAPSANTPEVEGQDTPTTEIKEPARSMAEAEESDVPGLLPAPEFESIPEAEKMEQPEPNVAKSKEETSPPILGDVNAEPLQVEGEGKAHVESEPKQNMIEEFPIEEMPIEEMPVEELPIEEMPIEQLPIEEMPLEEYHPEPEEHSPHVQPLDLPPYVVDLQGRIDQTIHHYAANWELNSRDHSYWDIMHHIVFAGVDSNIRRSHARGRPVNSIGWLCWNGRCKGPPKFISRDRYGLRVQKGPWVQGHYGQFLAMLAQSGVYPSYEVRVDGNKYTVADIIDSEQKFCRRGIELTFILLSMSYYLPDTDQVWKNYRGENWNIERLISEEISSPILRDAACGGTHRLMGLSYAIRARVREGKPLTGEFKRADIYIRDYQDYTLALQNTDGSFSTEWFRRKEARRDLDRRLQTTGHILEWMAFSVDRDRLLDPQMIKAAAYLNNLLWTQRDREWEIGPLGHALKALKIYNARLRTELMPPGTPSVVEPAEQPRSQPSGRVASRPHQPAQHGIWSVSDWHPVTD